LKANGTNQFFTVAAPNGDLVGTNDSQTLTNKTFGSGTTFSSTIGVASGGTGATTYTAGILKANGTSAFTTVTAPSSDIVGLTDTQTLLNKTFGSGTVFSTPIGVASGGTGLTSYTIGDIVYANTSSSLAKLPDVATGSALISGGIGVAPAYGKVGLTTHVSGTLPVANGGTGLSSITGYVKGTGTSALSESLTIPVADNPSSLKGRYWCYCCFNWFWWCRTLNFTYSRHSYFRHTDIWNTYELYWFAPYNWCNWSSSCR
jgi:hypothetical protein